MTITSLIDNISTQGFPVEHGLSLYIRLEDGTSVLFDMGQSDLFLHNAQRLGLRIEDVNLTILSHGHYDHGGGLSSFLSVNSHASVYVQADAFLPHYSLRANGLAPIGLDPTLATHPQVVFCSGVTHLSPSLTLFDNVQGKCCYPPANRRLFGPDSHLQDAFSHEQHLLIQENNLSVLFAGCAHAGIVNIIDRATDLIGHAPSVVVAGWHIMNSGLSPKEDQIYLTQLAHELNRYPHTVFYTMHCTGIDAFRYLQPLLPNRLFYLDCGNRVKI